MGDNIQELPIDDLPPTHDEKEMIHWMFPGKDNVQQSKNNVQAVQQPPVLQPLSVPTTRKFHLEIKALFIIILMFLALSNSWTDGLFKKFIPMTTNSSIILTICKSIVFAIMLMMFLNLYYKNI
jgi:uncharacterized integral membrane protein